MPECTPIHSGRNSLLSRERLSNISNKIMKKTIQTLIWIMIKMKLMFLVITLACTSLNAAVWSQEKTIDLQLGEVNLETLFEQMQQRTHLRFIFNHEDVQGYTVNANLKGKTIAEILDKALADKPLKYEIMDGHIVISPKRLEQNQQPEMIVIKGKVTDKSGHPMPGVTVMLKGTTFGAATDVDGKYEMTIQKKYATILVFSFVGMKTQEVAINGKTEINVKLEDDAKEIEEVVVTGIFKKSRESYTGSVTTISNKELKMFKGQNLLSTLNNIDPAFNIVANNTLGSNPNALPEINIRGNSSLPMSMEELNNQTAQRLNQPLIIMDGFEITLEKLMDFNDEDVESINILKDASATAIYGSRGANGVIVVTTKKPEAGKLQITAKAGFSLEMPDLSSYNLLHADEKLALEKEVGLYDGKEGDPHDIQKMEEMYYATLKDVIRGVDTYWLSEPVRIGVGQKYNLRLEGGSEEFRWGAGVYYNKIQGAMKDSDRNTFSGTLTLSYTFKNLIFQNQMILDYNNSSESKYGTFSEYAKMNPYWMPTDEYGNTIPIYTTMLGTEVENPLYNATLNTKNDMKSDVMTNNFSIEWNIIDDLQFRGQFGISKGHSRYDKFLPAEHSSFNTDAYKSPENFFRKGSYEYRTGENTSLESRVTLSYSKLFAEKHQLYVGLDWSLMHSKDFIYTFKAEGFNNQDYNFLGNALMYERNGKPTGSEEISRQVGFTGNLNYTYDNRYYADFSFRADGSSQFGGDKRFAPFYSIGVGWNIHREKFMEEQQVVNLLRLRGSYGKTGSQQFSSYQALRTYQNLSSERYMNWSGVEMLGLGNEDLEWQITDQYDLGIELGLWQNRLSLTFDAYKKITSNLLSQMDLPLANGFPSYTANIGEVNNIGFEAGVNGYVIRNTEKEVIWMLGTKLAYTKNEITKLSDAIKNQMSNYVGKNTTHNMLREGDSRYAIYAVPSLGIDPSTGKELYVDADGNVTTTWQGGARRYCGQTEPKFRGNFNSLFTYKDFTLNLNFGFHWGGQQYNQTLLNKVEVTNYDIEYNVDERVWSDRWQKPGDLKPFKGYGNENTLMSSRFIMDDNVFQLQSASLQYRWHSPFVTKLGMRSINFDVNMSDVFYISSIKRERGTEYPFARRIEFAVNLIF